MSDQTSWTSWGHWGRAIAAAMVLPGLAAAQTSGSSDGKSEIRRRLIEFFDAASGIWNYELVNAGGASLTVGSVAFALILLMVGYRLSRRLSRGLANLLSKRFEVESGHASALETLGFYFLFISFGVTALRLIHFPLTAFTIAGGALAIGVGFGSQNLMNNFISGLILLIERPVRVGDLVEVENTYGTIEHIGARSTRVKAADNTHIIVPNSFFLQNNVENFTLSDDILRGVVKVGVAYGSPTRRVEELVRRALSENPRVLSDHEPQIIFAEFGDNSLNFEAFFWTRARSLLQRKIVESEIRYRIDDLFREEGIVIAFPQRDVHLDVERPLEVRVMREEAESEPTDKRT